MIAVNPILKNMKETKEAVRPGIFKMFTFIKGMKIFKQYLFSIHAILDQFNVFPKVG
jgi:hypothetical protein